MKYIITEEQNTILTILRRIHDEDWYWIQEIVDEGTDMDNPCDFKTEEIYLERLCADSARTYLYNYYTTESEVGSYKRLMDYLISLIKKRMGDDIIEYYNDKKEDCEEF